MWYAVQIRERGKEEWLDFSKEDLSLNRDQAKDMVEQLENNYSDIEVRMISAPVNPANIKILHNRTRLPMLKCKNALIRAGDKLEEALILLREENRPRYGIMED